MSLPILASRSASRSPAICLKETNTLGGEAFDEASTGDDKGRDDVDTMPPSAIRLQLEKDDVLQQSLVIARSTIKWSFGDLTSGNGRTVAKITAGGSFDDRMGC